MKLALKSQQSINNDINQNFLTIRSHAISEDKNTDMICFGEGFLHGFDALTWDYNKDKHIAITNDSHMIHDIRKLASENGLSIGFGYFEHEVSTQKIYCSYMVIDAYGHILMNYRRVSKGWKDQSKTDKHYAEGNELITFQYMGKKIALCLCGDLWYPKNIKKINKLTKDFLLWPLHIDYSIEMWKREKILYQRQSAKINAPVLMVNNVSTSSLGGSCYFKDGKVFKELPMDCCGTLIVEI